MPSIPVYVQKINQPLACRKVGAAPDMWTAERVARHIGVPSGHFIDGKLVKRGGNKHWLLVADTELAKLG